MLVANNVTDILKRRKLMSNILLNRNLYVFTFVYFMKMTNLLQINYLCLYFARGIVHFNNQKYYWKTSNTYHGLLGSNFFKSVMGYRRFLELSRFFTVKSNWLTQLFNELSSKYWNPGEEISYIMLSLYFLIFDILSYQQMTILNCGKDQRGNTNWQLVFQHTFKKTINNTQPPPPSIFLLTENQAKLRKLAIALGKLFTL